MPSSLVQGVSSPQQSHDNKGILRLQAWPTLCVGIKITWKDMQSLLSSLCFALQLLKLQLCIPINHRVDTNKLQHRLFGVRSCIRDNCSLPNGM